MNTEILFVDDDADILAGFQRSLRKQFTIDTALGGAQALELVRGRKPYSVVVADMRMPGMNGVEFLIELEKISPDTVRVMLTGNADQKTARDAVNQGHIFRFLTKPCPPDELVSSLHAARKQYQLVTAERDVLERTLNGSAKMLSEILATHDAPAFGKSERLRDHMRAFADHFNIKQTWDLEFAAMLSRIGCVTIPQALLDRSRAGKPLTPAESELLRRIPQIGHDLLWNIPRLESAARVVLYQAKNFDGSGFPEDKVAGEDIPIGSRILRVLQDLIAAESDCEPTSKILDSMTRRRGVYDPRVLEAVAAVFDICLPVPVSTAPPARAVSLKELRVGWIAASDICTRDGVPIVPAGAQISPMLLQRLRNFSDLGDLEEPLFITP